MERALVFATNSAWCLKPRTFGLSFQLLLIG